MKRPYQQFRNTHTIAFDPGKLNTWFTVWDGRSLITAAPFVVPTTVAEIATPAFQASIVELFGHLKLHAGDHLVIERYVHRPNEGGNVSEIIQAIIWTLVSVGVQSNLKVFLYLASEHKNSFNKYHRARYPGKLIKRLGDRHGTWRPKLKRTDPCQHVIDAATVGCYHILKQSGII